MDRDRLESILARARAAQQRSAEAYAHKLDKALAYTAAKLPDYAGVLAKLPDYAEMAAEFAAREQTIKEAIVRQERRRKRLEDIIAKNDRCKRKGCKGKLEIRDNMYGDTVIGSSLVCNFCNYERFDSPEYARCVHADAYLEAAEKLEGKPPLPASYNAYHACELYLRELGGIYHYLVGDDDDKPDFVPPTREHALVTLRGRLEESRRDRLDVKQVDGESFKEMLFRLPQGLWPLLRYGEEQSLEVSSGQPTAEPSIGKDGRLHINEVDVYAVLVRMGGMLKEFVAEEFRRNRI